MGSIPASAWSTWCRSCRSRLRALEDAVAARDRFAALGGRRRWALPCFVYGPERSLPDVRRGAFRRAGARRGPARAPSDGRRRAPSAPGPCWSPTTSGCGTATSTLARRLAAGVRGPSTCGPSGCAVGDHVQVSMNLVDPLDVGPAAVYDDRWRPTGPASTGPSWWACVPRAVLEPSTRGVGRSSTSAPERTIEARLERSVRASDSTPG